MIAVAALIVSTAIVIAFLAFPFAVAYVIWRGPSK